MFLYFKVIWIRKKDNSILTWGLHTYTMDQRFSTSFNNKEWTLEIKNTNFIDRGLYECRTSSNSSVMASLDLVNQILKLCFLLRKYKLRQIT